MNLIVNEKTMTNNDSDNYFTSDHLNNIDYRENKDDNKDDTTKNNNIKINNSTPWVEKYRPSKFDDIVLDDVNKKIIESIIENNYFPNLLFYGPPGTGKKTTIINMINA